jgi:hypothetical protein
MVDDSRIYGKLENQWPNLVEYVKEKYLVEDIRKVELGIFPENLNYVVVKLSDEGEMWLSGCETEADAKETVLAPGRDSEVDSVWFNDKKIGVVTTVQFTP